MCYILQWLNTQSDWYWHLSLYTNIGQLQLQTDKYRNKKSDICIPKDIYLRIVNGLFFPYMLSNGKYDFAKKVNFYFYSNIFFLFKSSYFWMNESVLV